MSKPNLVCIMPEQLRANFLGCYGAQCMETPQIDGLLGHGVRCDCAYSAHPVWLPARVSLMTGNVGGWDEQSEPAARSCSELNQEMKR
jgi:arylsulfatase A-like enzyme